MSQTPDADCLATAFATPPLHMKPVAMTADGLDRLRRILADDPIAGAYMLGDLDPVYAPFCAWWVAHAGGRDTAAILVYTGLSAPALLTHGDVAGIEAILSRFSNDLPPRAHVHLLAEHVDAFHAHFELDRLRTMVRMGCHGAALTVPPQSDPGAYGPVERLGHRDTGEIMEVYARHPDSFFEPHQLSTGHYFGVRLEGRLVAVAGVHVASRSERLAVLGNIVTAPEHRGRGLSTRVTGHLCRTLVEDGMAYLALNVERQNTSAIRVYEKLGFKAHCTYLEGFIVRALGRARALEA
jgi:GNAT superfamily N-acetyltransferase